MSDNRRASAGMASAVEVGSGAQSGGEACLKSSKKPIGIDSFALHIIAMAVMLVDHIGYHQPDGIVMRMIGRLAFPIFAFLIAEGFYKTSCAWKYALRMVIFAVVTELPYDLYFFGDTFVFHYQNVLWTFAIAIGAMAIVKKAKELPIYAYFFITVVACVGAYYLAEWMCTDYSGGGVLTVLLFYFYRGNSLRSMTAQLVGMFILNWYALGSWGMSIELFGEIYNVPIQALAILSIIPIWFYNGEHGYYNKGVKYVYYLFYPVHLGVLYLIMQSVRG